MKEYMREFNYMAECATLNFETALMHDNIDFKWSGFNDSMPNYISETISRI
jgi:secreted Zn-dependent insulinase-like peptidase